MTQTRESDKQDVDGNVKHILTIDLDWSLTDRQNLEIISLCTKLFKTNIPIYFIKQHHHAYDLIDKNSIIYNIDHHHDIFYNSDHLQYLNENKVDEGSWVMGAIFEKKIKGYIWIKNYNSDYDEKVLLKHTFLRNLEIFKIFNNLSDLKIPKTDKVIICERACYNKSTSFTYQLLKNLCVDLQKTYEEIEKPNDLSYNYLK